MPSASLAHRGSVAKPRRSAAAIAFRSTTTAPMLVNAALQTGASRSAIPVDSAISKPLRVRVTRDVSQSATPARTGQALVRRNSRSPVASA